MKPHIKILDFLRALAALSVAWFHFTNAQFSDVFDAYAASGKYGWLGVQVFFVVSGFIIPYSMLSGGYGLRAFFRFLAKRLIRLDPPYLASIALVLGGYWVSAGIQGKASTFTIDWVQVAAHLGYVNAFLNLPWLQMTYWSLAIEFQYYIFAGIAYPLLIYRGRYASWIILLAFCALTAISSSDKLFPFHSPVFLIGIATFRLYSLNKSYRDFAILSGGATCLLLLSGQYPQILAALSTAGAILFLQFRHSIFDFLGRISYSIYLLHVFIGNICFGLAIKYLHNLQVWKFVLPPVALIVTVAASYGLYRLIELPSQRLSSRIKYRTGQTHTLCAPLSGQTEPETPIRH